MVKIRPARTSDVKAIRQLVDSYAAPGHMLSKETVTLYESVQEFTVAEVDGKVVGFTHFLFRPSTWSINDYCYLEDLFVDSDIRGKGVGRALIDAVVERAQAKCAPRVYWTTQNGNSQARILYDSFGYPSEFVQYRIPLD